MDNAFADNRNLQATTEGNKATRITAMMIQVDSGDLGVVRVVGNERMRDPQINRNHSEFTRDPTALRSSIERFFRSRLGRRLTSVIQHQPS